MTFYALAFFPKYLFPNVSNENPKDQNGSGYHLWSPPSLHKEDRKAPKDRTDDDDSSCHFFHLLFCLLYLKRETRRVHRDLDSQVVEC
jgi:hypothetical protein